VADTGGEVAAEGAARPDRWPTVEVAPLPWRGGRLLDLVALGGVALTGLVLRVLQRSPLWLDEALSSNIAALPLGDIPEALKHDGHPPLYYVLLHVWQDVLGDGDASVRLLSGVVGLALVPLAFVAAGRIGGRRAAWSAALLVALNPYVLRYATEARMYELLMVLSLAGWLVADRALRRPDPVRLVLLALITSAMLWTHYWGLWLTIASGLGILARAFLAHRHGDAERRRSSLLVAGSLVGGAVLFLPWVPTLLYQSAHTGTPWAEPSIPTEVAATSLLDLGGGTAGEGVLLAVALALLVALGLVAAPGTGSRVELDLRTRPEVRRLGLVIGGTLAVATVTSFAADAAYATRYFSVVAALVLVLAGVGASRVGGPVAFRIVLAAVLLLGLVSATRAAVSKPRTQARQVAEAIEPTIAPDGPGPLVLVCPDQLGPALSRELPDDTDIATYPRFAAPELVDWVDYQDRVDDADPAAFAIEALERAGDREIWLVWSGAYTTHEGTCEALANALQSVRTAGTPVVLADENAYEPANAFRFPAA
jgi:mannosyltransferase